MDQNINFLTFFSNSVNYHFIYYLGRGDFMAWRRDALYGLPSSCSYIIERARSIIIWPLLTRASTENYLKGKSVARNYNKTSG